MLYNCINIANLSKNSGKMYYCLVENCKIVSKLTFAFGKQFTLTLQFWSGGQHGIDLK